MTPGGPGDVEIQRLLRAVQMKVLAEAESVIKAKGDIRIRIFRKGTGYQIDLTVSI